MIGWGLQGTVPLPAGERLVPRGEARPTGQALSAPNIKCAFPRGRKRGGLRNRREMVGTGRDGLRTDTMGLGGGPQGNNLFPQAGRLTSLRKVSHWNIATRLGKLFVMLTTRWRILPSLGLRRPSRSRLPGPSVSLPLSQKPSAPQHTPYVPSRPAF